MFFNSSWSIFSPLTQKEQGKQQAKKEDSKLEKDFYPFMHSGKSFSFEQEEKKLVKHLREWQKKEFLRNPGTFNI